MKRLGFEYYCLLLLLLILSIGYAAAYFIPEQFDAFLPGNKVVKRVGSIGITSFVLPTLSIVALVIPKLRKPRVLYMLSGAFVLYCCMVISISYLAITYFYCSALLFGQAEKEGAAS